jgi:Skp family chaperone for outer membrane proteins
LFNGTLIFYFQAENERELQKAQSEREARLAEEMDRIHRQAMKEKKLR